MSVKYVAPVKKITKLPLVCDGSVMRLDVGDYTPEHNSLTLACPYFNVSSFKLKDPAVPGRVRFRMVRAPFNGQPVDDTYFFDLPLATGLPTVLDSRALFEYAEAGRPLYWAVSVRGCSEVVLETRYVRYAQVW